MRLTLFSAEETFSGDIFEATLEGGGAIVGGATSNVLQIVNCRRNFRQFYPQISKFDQKKGSRKPAYLPVITVCQQGLQDTI